MWSWSGHYFPSLLRLPTTNYYSNTKKFPLPRWNTDQKKRQTEAARLAEQRRQLHAEEQEKNM